MGLGNGRALSFVLGHFGKDRCLNICRWCNTFNRTLMKKTLQFSVGQLNGTREERNKLRQVSSARTFVVASIRIGIFVVVSMQKDFCRQNLYNQDFPHQCVWQTALDSTLFI